MSMTRDKGFIIFQCNNCLADLDTETKNFPDAMEKMKAEGWKTVRYKNENWSHFCSDRCRIEFESYKNFKK